MPENCCLIPSTPKELSRNRDKGRYMHHFETALVIAAPVDRIWAVLMDVRHWPDWTSSISRIEPLDDGPMGLGRQIRIIQPKLRPAVWRISEFSEREKFVWVSSSPGVTVTAGHSIRPNRNGSLVTLTLVMTGILSGIVASLAGNRTRKYLSYEIHGLKRRCEEDRAF
jgi:uncharacterized membrane protein